MFEYDEYPDLIYEGLIYELSSIDTEIVTEGLNLKSTISSMWKKISELFKRACDRLKKFTIKMKDKFIEFKNKVKEILQKGQAFLLNVKLKNSFDSDRLLQFAEKDIPNVLKSMGPIEGVYDYFNKACAYYKDKPDEIFPLNKIKNKVNDIASSFFGGVNSFFTEIKYTQEEMKLKHKDLINCQKFLEIVMTNSFYNKLRDCSERIQVFDKWIDDTDFRSIQAQDAIYIPKILKDITQQLIGFFSVTIKGLSTGISITHQILTLVNLAAMPGLGYKSRFKEKEDEYKPQEYNPNKDDEPENSGDKPKYRALL